MMIIWLWGGGVGGVGHSVLWPRDLTQTDQYLDNTETQIFLVSLLSLLRLISCCPASTQLTSQSCSASTSVSSEAGRSKWRLSKKKAALFLNTSTWRPSQWSLFLNLILTRGSTTGCVTATTRTRTPATVRSLTSTRTSRRRSMRRRSGEPASKPSSRDGSTDARLTWKFQQRLWSNTVSTDKWNIFCLKLKIVI